MKKVMIFIILVVIGIFTFFFYNEVIKADKTLELLNNIDETFIIDNYSIFGTHFNISGCISKVLDNAKLVLKSNDKEFTLNSNYEIKDNETCFTTSSNINDSIYLDNLDTGNYLLLVKSNNKYYTLKNNTNYGNLEYYTITKNSKNKKVKILFNKLNDLDYVELKVTNSKLPNNVYDIAIDPGHGGKDTGAIFYLNDKEYHESDLALKVSLILNDELEKLGLKVKLTRDSDVTLSNYKDTGRAVIPNEYNTKYSISIHLNSSLGSQTYGGVEVYTPNNTDLTLAKLFADNLSDIVGYSKKATDRLINGVYYSYFTNESIEEYNNTLSVPYEIEVNSPDMFMIREVGGINTYAYVDGRNIKYGKNKYYNSNKTAEPYLIELAYINYEKDLEEVVNKPEVFAYSIKDALLKYLNLSS